MAVYRRHKLLKNVLAVSCRLGTFLFHGWHAPALPGRGAAPPYPTVKHVSPRVWKFAFSIMKCRKQSVRTLTQHRLTFTDICCWGDVWCGLHSHLVSLQHQLRRGSRAHAAHPWRSLSATHSHVTRQMSSICIFLKACIVMLPVRDIICPFPSPQEALINVFSYGLWNLSSI